MPVIHQLDENTMSSINHNTDEVTNENALLIKAKSVVVDYYRRVGNYLQTGQYERIEAIPFTQELFMNLQIASQVNCVKYIINEEDDGTNTVDIVIINSEGDLDKNIQTLIVLDLNTGSPYEW